MRPFLVALAGLGGLLAALVIGGLLSDGEKKGAVMGTTPTPAPVASPSPAGRQASGKGL